jgi:hypothetical protein
MVEKHTADAERASRWRLRGGRGDGYPSRLVAAVLSYDLVMFRGLFTTAGSLM